MVVSYARDGQKYILSYGGGVNSVALLLHLINERKSLDGVIFADTGGELPDTYAYTTYIEEFLNQQGIPFLKVRSRDSPLYMRCIRRKVIPSQIWRWCTRDYKIRPIHAYYRTLRTHVNQYLGISFEESDRAKESKVEHVSNLYPLIEEKMTREDCIDLIYETGLKPPVRSGCFFCPFNSISRWSEIYRNHSDLYHKAMELEETSKHFPNQKLTALSLRCLKENIENNDQLPVIRIKRLCGSECII